MAKRSHQSSVKSKSTLKSTPPTATSAKNAAKKGVAAVAAVKRPVAGKRLSAAHSSSSVPETIDNFSDSPSIDVDNDSIACADHDSEDADEEEVDPQKELGEQDNGSMVLLVLTICRGAAEDLALSGLYVFQIRGPDPDPRGPALPFLRLCGSSMQVSRWRRSSLPRFKGQVLYRQPSVQCTPMLW
jgi:hypothetical protein